MKFNKYSFLFVITLLLNVFVSQIFVEKVGDNYTFSTILIIFDTIPTVYCLSKLKDKNIGAILFVSYAVKILFMYFDLFGRNIFVLPNSGADTERFWGHAINNSAFDGYSTFLCILYALFGKQRLIFQYVNIIFSLLAELLLYNIIDKLKIKENIKLVCILLFCFMPNHLIFSSILLRETLMILLNTISLYFFIKFLKNNNTFEFVISVLFIIFSAYFHSSVITMVLPYSFFYIFYSKDKNNQYSKSSFIKMFFIAIMILVLYIGFGDYVLNYFNGLDSIDKISNKMVLYTDAGSAYLEFLAYNKSIPIMILTSPLKMVYFFFSPMIWDVRGVSDLIAIAGSSIFYIGIIFYHIKCKNKSEMSKILFAIIMVFGFTYGMSCFASGTAMRHREKIIPFLFTLLAIDLNNNKEEDVRDEEKSITYTSK